MKLKGISGFVFNTKAGRITADSNGVIETEEIEAIEALKHIGFEEIKEAPKEEKKTTAKPRKKGNKK